MANWTGLSRTNYFFVKDAEAFKKAAQAIGIEVIDSLNDDGTTHYGLLASDEGYWPSDYCDDDGNDLEFDIASFLVEHLADGEVAVVVSAGCEKARYATGSATAVRNDGSLLNVNLDDIYALVHGTWGIEPTPAEY